MKTCSVCGIPKDAGEFYKGKRTCIVCYAIKSKRWNTENRERKAQNDKRWKAANPERAQAIRKRHESANSEKIKARKERHRQNNAEPIKEYFRRRYQQHAERLREIGRKWRAANPDYGKQYAKVRHVVHAERDKAANREWREKNADYNKARSKQWTRENPDKVKKKAQRRRAKKKGAQGSHSIAEWRALVDRYSGFCLCCGEHFGFKKLTEDHVVPLAWGGSDGIENIQPLCRLCNSRKSHLHATDYRKNWEPARIKPAPRVKHPN